MTDSSSPSIGGSATWSRCGQAWRSTWSCFPRNDSKPVLSPQGTRRRPSERRQAGDVQEGEARGRPFPFDDGEPGVVEAQAPVQRGRSAEDRDGEEDAQLVAVPDDDRVRGFGKRAREEGESALPRLLEALGARGIAGRHALAPGLEERARARRADLSLRPALEGAEAELRQAVVEPDRNLFSDSSGPAPRDRLGGLDRAPAGRGVDGGRRAPGERLRHPLRLLAAQGVESGIARGDHPAGGVVLRAAVADQDQPAGHAGASAAPPGPGGRSRQSARRRSERSTSPAARSCSLAIRTIAPSLASAVPLAWRRWKRPGSALPERSHHSPSARCVSRWPRAKPTSRCSSSAFSKSSRASGDGADGALSISIRSTPRYW